MASKSIPPFRIEAKNDTGSFCVVDLANTSTQAKRKLADFGDDARMMDNAPLADVTPPDTAALQQANFVIEQLGRENMELRNKLAKYELRDTQQAALDAAARARVDAIVGPTPLPFDVGAKLRDIHTGAIVTVIAINPNGKPGFDWEFYDTAKNANQSGFCPLASVGCFTPADAA